MNALSFPHRVTRLVFEASQPYEKLCSRYEAAVPPADPRWLGSVAGRHARWPGTGTDSYERSAHGFVLHWRADMRPLMTAAGELRPCTGYLMGHAIPERLYRQDPAVMLYSLLRTQIYIDSGDRTRFAVDQPSTVLSGFTDPAIAKLGVDLDRRLAELLHSLGVEASQVIGAARPAGPRAEAV
jgi:hypothetical protein